MSCIRTIHVVLSSMYSRHQWHNQRFEPGEQSLAEGDPLANTQKKVKKR